MWLQVYLKSLDHSIFLYLKHKLEDCYKDDNYWSKKLSSMLFNELFDVKFCTTASDLGKYEIENDVCREQCNKNTPCEREVVVEVSMQSLLKFLGY